MLESYISEMKEPSDLTDLFTKFFEEEHYYQSDHFLSRITHQIKAAPPVQVVCQVNFE